MICQSCVTLELCADEEDNCAEPFQLAKEDLEVGQGIGLLAYPLAWDKKAREEVAVPYWGYGHISGKAGVKVAAGSYDGGSLLLLTHHHATEIGYQCAGVSKRKGEGYLVFAQACSQQGLSDS